MEAQPDNRAGCSVLCQAPRGAPNPILGHQGAPHHGEPIQALPRGWGMFPGWALGSAPSTLKLARGCACISLVLGTLGDTKPGHLPSFQLCAGGRGGREGRSAGSDRSIN